MKIKDIKIKKTKKEKNMERWGKEKLEKEEKEINIRGPSYHSLHNQKVCDWIQAHKADIHFLHHIAGFSFKDIEDRIDHAIQTQIDTTGYVNTIEPISIKDAFKKGKPSNFNN